VCNEVKVILIFNIWKEFCLKLCLFYGHRIILILYFTRDKGCQMNMCDVIYVRPFYLSTSRRKDVSDD